MKQTIVIFAVLLIIASTAGCSTNKGKKNPDAYNAEARQYMQRAEEIMKTVGINSQIFVVTPALDPYRDLAEVRSKKLLQQALILLYDAYKLEPNWSEIAYDISICENGLQNYERGIDFANHALKTDTSNPWPHISLAVAHQMLGKKAKQKSLRNSHYSKAIAAYKAFLKMRPEDLRLEPFTQMIKQLELAMQAP